MNVLPVLGLVIIIRETLIQGSDSKIANARILSIPSLKGCFVEVGMDFVYSDPAGTDVLFEPMSLIHMSHW